MATQDYIGAEVPPSLAELIAADPETARWILDGVDKTAAAPLELTRWDGNTPDKQPWVLEGWLPRRAVTIFTGAGGSGKSYLALQLAAGIAGGVADWGGPVNIEPEVQGEPVVIASWEETAVTIFRRLAGLSLGRNWITPAAPLYIASPQGRGMVGQRPLWQAGRWDTGAPTDILRGLQAAVARVNPALLVLDSAAAVYDANENDRAAVRQFLRELGNWALDSDLAILLIAHPPKSAAAFSGSTDWLAGCRAMWGMERGQGNDDRKLWLEKSNYIDGTLPAAARMGWERGGLVYAGDWESGAKPSTAAGGSNGHNRNPYR